MSILGKLWIKLIVWFYKFGSNMINKNDMSESVELSIIMILNVFGIKCLIKWIGIFSK